MRCNPLIYTIVLLFASCFSSKKILEQDGIVVNNLKDSLLFQIFDQKEPGLNEVIRVQKTIVLVLKMEQY